jgi:uncharacterized protein YdeI (YjbR/CyaY-like superfamily)
VIPFRVVSTRHVQAIEAYICRLVPDMARIVRVLRDVARGACPELEEALKWGLPTLSYKGIVAQIAGFKQHARLVFWKGSLLESEWMELVGETQVMETIRIEKPEDIPPESVLVDLFARAVDFTVRGIKAGASRTRNRAPLEAPDRFVAALQTRPEAASRFDAMPLSHRREYIDWLVEAKREETRLRRLQHAVGWIAEGKQRNWKHL